MVDYFDWSKKKKEPKGIWLEYIERPSIEHWLTGTVALDFFADIKKNWTEKDKQVLKVKVESNRKQAYNDHRPRQI